MLTTFCMTVGRLVDTSFLGDGAAAAAAAAARVDDSGFAFASASGAAAAGGPVGVSTCVDDEGSTTVVGAVEARLGLCGGLDAVGEGDEREGLLRSSGACGACPLSSETASKRPWSSSCVSSSASDAFARDEDPAWSGVSASPCGSRAASGPLAGGCGSDSGGASSGSCGCEAGGEGAASWRVRGVSSSSATSSSWPVASSTGSS